MEEYLGGAGSAQPYWREKIKARNQKENPLEKNGWNQFDDSKHVLGLNGVSWFS